MAGGAMAYDGRERRAAVRALYMCDVECHGAGPDPVRPLVRDISTTGAFIETTTSLDIGQSLGLRFSTPSGEVVVEAEVARTVAEGVGVRFVSLSDELSAVLARMVAEAVQTTTDGGSEQDLRSAPVAAEPEDSFGDRLLPEGDDPPDPTRH